MSANQSLYSGSNLASAATSLNASLTNLPNIGGLGSQGGVSGSAGLTSKDNLNALLAQTMTSDPQAFIKQQQKLMQCLPPAQRKLYESMLADMEQAMKMT